MMHRLPICNDAVSLDAPNDRAQRPAQPARWSRWLVADPCDFAGRRLLECLEKLRNQGPEIGRRFVRARSTITAIEKRGRSRWNARLRSTVTKASNWPSASKRRSLFLIVAHPIWGTVLTSWPTRSLPSRRSTHSSRRTLTTQRRPCELSLPQEKRSPVHA